MLPAMNETRRTLCKLAGLTVVGAVTGCGTAANSSDGGSGDGGVLQCGTQTILVGVNVADIPFSWVMRPVCGLAVIPGLSLSTLTAWMSGGSRLL